MKQTIINFSLILLSLGILLVCAQAGWGGARVQAESEMVYKNTLAMQLALQFFSNDYDRFPSALEFTRPEIMQSYVSPFPPKEFNSGLCGQTWVYTRPASSRYTLDFCLAGGITGLDKGWHKISGNLE